MALENEDIGTDEYTPEELAMFQQDVEEVEDTEEVEDVEVEEETEEVEENPWAWADGQDPEKIRNTWEKFTPEWENIKKQREELEPYMQLKDEIEQDPHLQAYIRDYFDKGLGNAPEKELANIKQEVDALRNERAVERELIDLEKFVTAEGLPEFNQREVMEFAAKHGSPSLEDAYKVMNFDAIRQLTEDKAFEKVKKLKGATPPKVGRSDKVDDSVWTEDKIANLSDEEFQENYDAIMNFYTKKR